MCFILQGWANLNLCCDALEQQLNFAHMSFHSKYSQCCCVEADLDYNALQGKRRMSQSNKCVNLVWAGREELGGGGGWGVSPRSLLVNDHDSDFMNATLAVEHPNLKGKATNLIHLEL